MIPLVSICIPTYNGAKFIKEAMDSAIAQTYANLEIIISDDASKDGTLSVIESYKNKTLIPIHIYNHKPQGIGANWNHSVRKAQGDYIKFLFQDDILEPTCIEKMMQMALTNPKIGLVYCKREFIYTNINPEIQDFIEGYSHLHIHWDSFKVTEGIQSGKTYLKDRQLLNSPKNKVGEPTCVLQKKECFSKVGYFNDVMQQTLDIDYWYRVMRYYDVGFIDAILVKFRLHEQQASVLNKNKGIQDKELLYKSYYKYLLRFLHPTNQLKLLKLYHPIFKALVKLKQTLYAKH